VDIKIFRGFLKFQKPNFVRGKFLKIRSSINLSWGQERSHNKFGPDRFSRFDVYWIQTDRQAKFLGRIAPIFYFNCEHVLFVNIVKQTNKIFKKSNFVRGNFLKTYSSINLPWGHARNYLKCIYI